MPVSADIVTGLKALKYPRDHTKHPANPRIQMKSYLELSPLEVIIISAEIVVDAQ